MGFYERLGVELFRCDFTVQTVDFLTPCLGILAVKPLGGFASVHDGDSFIGGASFKRSQ